MAPCKAVAVTGEATTTRYVAAPKADLASSIRRQLQQRMRKRRWRLTSFSSPFSCRRARRRPRSKPRSSLTERERSLSVSSQRRKTAGWRRRGGVAADLAVSRGPSRQACRCTGQESRAAGRGRKQGERRPEGEGICRR